MIKIQLDILIDSRHVRERPAVVGPGLIVQLALDNLGHPFHPFRIRVLGQPLTSVPIGIKPAISVLIHVRQQCPDLFGCRLPISDMVLFPNPLDQPADLLRRQVKIDAGRVLDPQLRLGKQPLRYVNHRLAVSRRRGLKAGQLVGEIFQDTLYDVLEPVEKADHEGSRKHEEHGANHDHYPELRDTLRHTNSRLYMLHNKTIYVTTNAVAPTQNMGFVRKKSLNARSVT